VGAVSRARTTRADPAQKAKEEVMRKTKNTQLQLLILQPTAT